MTTVNDFFDHIYCINLDRRPDRWEETKQQLERHRIRNVERFSAIDGFQIDLSDHSMRPGDVGPLLTHINIFNDAIKNNYKNFLMLEDDVEFYANFEEEFSLGIEGIPDYWQMIYFGGNHSMGSPTRVNEKICIIRSTLSTHAVAFKKEIYEEVLSLLNKSEPADMTYAKNNYKFHCFGFDPPVAWQRPGWSDVNNINVNYDFLRGGR